MYFRPYRCRISPAIRALVQGDGAEGRGVRRHGTAEVAAKCIRMRREGAAAKWSWDGTASAGVGRATGEGHGRGVDAGQNGYADTGARQRGAGA
jgi:hypothetical protein